MSPAVSVEASRRANVAGPGDQTRARTLIINADDFGISPAVNAGIVDTIEHGPVRSVSTLVTLPGFRDAIERIRSFGQLVGVGLHLDLLIGPPLTAARSLVDPAHGNFYSFPALVTRVLLGRVSAEDVRVECAAQLQRLAAALDRAGLGPVTHVDSHRHVHVLPELYAAVAAAARESGVLHVRVPREPPRYNLPDVPATGKKGLLALISRNIEMRNGFVGTSLQGGTHFEARLLALLDHLPNVVTELMVHRGFMDPGLAAIDGYTWQRDVERRTLVSDAVRARIERRDIALAHFGE